MNGKCSPRGWERDRGMGNEGVKGFDHVGFYLHASWVFNYPLAVRTWAPADYDAMFRLLGGLGMDRVMIWPMSEIAPPPLSESDAQHLRGFRDIIATARQRGLECWLTFCPNLSTREEIRGTPVKDRVFYPFMRTFRLDDEHQFHEYIAHMRSLLACMNNADGYVFIDGDPGGYPGAHPRDYFRMLGAVRAILDDVAATRPKLIPWIWCGWGADWAGEGAWKPDLRKLVRPFLEELKRNPPAEPWELLPGRSIRDGWGNGRINFELVEEAGLVERSTLMTYEIIEFEPTPPAFVIQFDDIRRVVGEELRYAGAAKGIFGNAQQPVSALHNLIYFARCAKDPSWLTKSDDEVLHAIAQLLGGDAAVLVPAWKSATARLEELPADLSERVRGSRLKSDLAACIPGGPETYLGLLGDFVEARRTVLSNTAVLPRTRAEAIVRLRGAVAGIIAWWLRHRYVFSGEGGPHFDWNHAHHASFIAPLHTWIRDGGVTADTELQKALADEITGMTGMPRETAESLIARLFAGVR